MDLEDYLAIQRELSAAQGISDAILAAKDFGGIPKPDDAYLFRLESHIGRRSRQLEQMEEESGVSIKEYDTELAELADKEYKLCIVFNNSLEEVGRRMGIGENFKLGWWSGMHRQVEKYLVGGENPRRCEYEINTRESKTYLFSDSLPVVKAYAAAYLEGSQS